MSKTVDYRKVRRLDVSGAKKYRDYLAVYEHDVDASGNNESCSEDCSLGDKGCKPPSRR
jgi:hypothetical protein